MYTDSWAVVPGEVATAVKFSQLGANDDFLKDAIDNSIAAGAIVAWPVATPPSGWLICNGANVSRSTYSNLFAVLGTSRGVGDGSTTFALPNLVGKVISGVDAGDTNLNAAGKQYGARSVVLTDAQMPSHNHSGTTSSSGNHDHGVADRWFKDAGGSGNYNMTSGGNGYARSLSTINVLSAGNHNHSITVSTKGSDQAHNNMQPTDAEYWIIKY